jgi:SAM-dependent methyltransferase
MSSWIAKAAVQKTISGLPWGWGYSANDFLRRHVSKGAGLSSLVFEQRCINAARHVEVGLPLRDEPVLELGTGWYPVVPVALYLCGFSSITSVDLVQHTDAEGLREVALRFVDLEDRQALRAVLPHYAPDRIDKLRQVVRGTGRTLAPADVDLTLMTGDAARLPISVRQTGLIISNSVMEHIYPEVLNPILVEFRRILRPDGCMSHVIDLSDHFAHLDARITPYNFLRFTDRWWRAIDNSIQPQSRLRVDDYRNLFAETGWVSDSETTNPGDETLLHQIKLADRFGAKAPEVNAVMEMHSVLRLAG